MTTFGLTNDRSVSPCTSRRQQCFLNSAMKHLVFKSKVEENLQKPFPITDYLQTFLNLTYFIGSSPFRIKIAHLNKNFVVQLHQNKFQKLFSFLTTFLCLIWIIRDIKPTHQKQFQNHPAFLFQNVLNAVNCVSKLTVLKRLWIDKSVFLQIFQHILANETFFRNRYKTPVKPKILAGIICIIYTVIAISEIASGQTTGGPKGSPAVCHLLYPLLEPCVNLSKSGMVTTPSFGNVSFWMFDLWNGLLDTGWIHRYFTTMNFIRCIKYLYNNFSDFKAVPRGILRATAANLRPYFVDCCKRFCI